MPRRPNNFYRPVGFFVPTKDALNSGSCSILRGWAKYFRVSRVRVGKDTKGFLYGVWEACSRSPYGKKFGMQRGTVREMAPVGPSVLGGLRANPCYASLAIGESSVRVDVDCI